MASVFVEQEFGGHFTIEMTMISSEDAMIIANLLSESDSPVVQEISCSIESQCRMMTE
jgi:hypothetical protein